MSTFIPSINILFVNANHDTKLDLETLYDQTDEHCIEII